jgi:hypothetical protein
VVRRARVSRPLHHKNFAHGRGALNMSASPNKRWCMRRAIQHRSLWQRDQATTAAAPVAVRIRVAFGRHSMALSGWIMSRPHPSSVALTSPRYFRFLPFKACCCSSGAPGA